MKILEATYLLTCNENFDILKHGAICFDKHIIALGKADELRKRFPDAKYEKLPPNSVLMPGLINPHVHLEFSANQTTLAYGSFMKWLASVMQNRDDLSLQCTDELLANVLTSMNQSGTTTIGAISSFGADLQACIDAPMRVVYFNEILGSRPDSVDILFEDFKERLRHSREFQSERFTPAISIHSPYSTHPILAKNTLDIARKDNLLVSTHFLESQAEKTWLDDGSGEFYEFFKGFSANPQPLVSTSDFLALFKGCKTLFTHCVQADNKEFKKIKDLNAAITHCPRSNRLLGTGLLDLEKVTNQTITLTIGTDGLSSNTTLNLWDELRCALFLHVNYKLTDLAKLLLQSVTINAAKALWFNNGELKEGKEADIIALVLPDAVKDKEQVALQTILHTTQTQQIFILGEKVEFY